MNLANILASAKESLARLDSWSNLSTGFGTSRDKSAQTFFGENIPLDDYTISQLYTFDDIAGKIVDASPRDEFREPFGLKGFDPEKASDVTQYLEPFNLSAVCTDGRIWGRCYGGCGTWIKVDDGLDPIEPLDLTRIQQVTALETIDKRYLQPWRYYTDGPKAGQVAVYAVQTLTGNGQAGRTIGYVHETRLVIWPGARTEMQAKIQRNLWDYSVLQKPYNALRSSGNTWKAIEGLTVDAQQGVYKIKDLWRMIASDPMQGRDSETKSGPTGGLLKRIQFMDLVRSVNRAIVLDAEGEDFTRIPTSFSGLHELSDKAWLRVAAAADMPVTIMTGQSPAGLQATGASDLRWWNGKVASEQLQTDEPRVKQILRVLLAARAAPKLDENERAKLSIVWMPLWAPTAAELAEMTLKAAQEAQVLIQEQVLTAEEWLLSQPEDRYPAANRKQREERLRDLAEAPPEERQTATLQLTPTDIAAVVTVNQALGSVGLPPMPGADGNMTVEAYRAKAQADAAPKPAPGAAPRLFGRLDAAEPAKLWAKLDARQKRIVYWIDGFDEDQPRDENGRWSESGGSSNGPKGGSSAVFGRELSSEQVDDLMGRPSDVVGEGQTEIRHGTNDDGEPTVEYRFENDQIQLSSSFERNENGKLVAKLEAIYVDEDAKGQGIGSKILAGQIEAYQKHGVEEVTLEAEKDGVYVWARAGFRVSDSEALADMRERFAEHVEVSGAPSSLASRAKTAHDISKVEHDGEKIGKEFLLEYDNILGDRVPMRLPKKDFGKALAYFKRGRNKDADGDGRTGAAEEADDEK